MSEFVSKDKEEIQQFSHLCLLDGLLFDIEIVWVSVRGVSGIAGFSHRACQKAIQKRKEK